MSDSSSPKTLNPLPPRARIFQGTKYKALFIASLVLTLLNLTGHPPAKASVARPTQEQRQTHEQIDFPQRFSAPENLDIPRSSEPLNLIHNSFPQVQVTQVIAQAPAPLKQGRQILLNNRPFGVAWQQATTGTVRTWIADVGLMEAAGLELLNTNDSRRQPVQWFDQSLTGPQSLPTKGTGQYRYLDITEFAKKAGWQITSNGATLNISTPLAQVTGLRQGKNTWGNRIVVELNRPTLWQTIWLAPSKPPTPTPRNTLDDGPPGRAEDDPSKPGSKDTPDDPTKPAPPSPQQPAPPPAQDWLISLNAQINPAVLQQTFIPNDPLKALKIEAAGAQTHLRIRIPLGWRPQVFSLGNPNRLVIDIRPDSLTERDILWAPGLRWRQQYRTLGTSRFPVVWLEINPRTSGLKLRPILSNPPALQGTSPLITMAERAQVSAAINAGFFNRINRLALGAIRQENRWLSGPILNRGALAWNDAGEFKLGRLTLQETLITGAGVRFPITHLNSAYSQAGMARYTPEWGANYTPFSNNEVIVSVEGSRVVRQSAGGEAGKTAFPIPAQGYLLVVRSNQATANQLAAGTELRIESTPVPADFNRYPYILGGGPVLVQNSQVVVDAKAEGFSDAYVRQTAIRSAIGRTAAGTLLIAAVHNRAGGAGATFAELAQLMQQMGAVDALNFDGGSSTSLYLGGQLIDRPGATAAQIHNGLGIFLQPQ